MNEDEVNEIDEINKIRLPDPIIKNRLIDYESDNGSDNNELDLELKLALDVSKNDFYDREEDKYVENEITLALELSMEDHLKRLKELSINRAKSLEIFCKKIKSLSYTQEDIEIRNYIENILSDYFDLNIDEIYVNDDMYDKLFKIIDTYYLIPTERKYKKTSIPESEDLIIRSIIKRK